MRAPCFSTFNLPVYQHTLNYKYLQYIPVIISKRNGLVKPDELANAYNPAQEVRRITSLSSVQESLRKLTQKQNVNKRIGGCSWSGKSLLRMSEALSSIPSTEKKRNKKKRKKGHISET